MTDNYVILMQWVMCPRYTETWPDYVHQELSRTINNIQAVRIIQRTQHYYFQDIYGHSDITLRFEGLVETVSRYDATDPRDRIYAMGNMIVDSDQWFEVDYRVAWEILVSYQLEQSLKLVACYMRYFCRLLLFLAI